MVNIFLIPYTALRHLSMALWCGVAGLIAWWLVLTAIVVGGADWPPSWDGPILMCAVSCGVAMASVVGEVNLRRLPMIGRLWRVALAGLLTAVFTLAWYGLWSFVATAVLFSGDAFSADAQDSSLVSLTFRAGAFAMGGFGGGCATAILRKGRGVVSHMAGGLAAGLAAGAVWHLLGSNLASVLSSGDLYLAGAGMGLTWGLVFGLLTWGIPDELYAGWLRVLSPYRYGRRIPVDSLDGRAKERFVGHFPRGLDLYLPLEEGVLELHVSVAMDSRRRYRARGLTLQPTVVRRFLERVDLRYDPARPAPLETELSSGDRIVLGEGETRAELEFIMLPREEQ